MGCLSSLALGFLLYFSMLFSTVLTGALFRTKQSEIAFCNEISRQKFDLSSSIKSAGFTSLTVCSFVTFFSAVISLAECLVKSPLFSALISALFEIGNAAARASALDPGLNIKIPLLGFALGFSGLSVILQAKAALPPQIKLKKLPIFKLVEGCLCAGISLGLYFMFYFWRTL